MRGGPFRSGNSHIPGCRLVTFSGAMAAPSPRCPVISAASLTFSNGVNLAHSDSVCSVPREDILGEGALGQVVRMTWNGRVVAVKVGARTADSIGTFARAAAPSAICGICICRPGCVPARRLTGAVCAFALQSTA